MRNTDEIPREEFEQRIKKGISLLNDPYRRALQKRQSEIFSNPDCNEWRDEAGQLTFGLKPKYKIEWDEINAELDLYRKNLYPELLFPLEDDEKQRETQRIKEDPEYSNLVKGLIYFSGEIHINDSSFALI